VKYAYGVIGNSWIGISCDRHRLRECRIDILDIHPGLRDLWIVDKPGAMFLLDKIMGIMLVVGDFLTISYYLCNEFFLA
jgi:hypothetical protein